MTDDGEVSGDLDPGTDDDVEQADGTGVVGGDHRRGETLGEQDRSGGGAVVLGVPALPSFLHADVLSRALAFAWHVFAEKPIGRTVAEASALADQAHKSDAVTGVGFSVRRLPGLAPVADAVAAGTIRSRFAPPDRARGANSLGVEVFGTDATPLRLHPGRRVPGADVVTGPANPYFTDDRKNMDTDFDTALSMVRLVGAALESAASHQPTDVG